MSEENNVVGAIAGAFKQLKEQVIFGYSGCSPMTEVEIVQEYQALGFGKDHSKGLHPDFSSEAVHGRILDKTSGLPPHERSGHMAPFQPQKQPASEVAVALLRNPPPEDIPQT